MESAYNGYEVRTIDHQGKLIRAAEFNVSKSGMMQLRRD